MNKALFIIFISVMICSCSVFYGPNTERAVQQLELGMSKQEAIQIMGNDYIIESVVQLDYNVLEILHFRATTYSDYLLHFVDGQLVEFHRYIAPTNTTTQQNSSKSSIDSDLIRQDILGDIMSEDTKDSRKRVSKDIFGNYIIEDNNGNKETVKKDIFGNTVIEDNKGGKKTVKKDIFGNTIIEDNRGNKQTIKKDIFGNTVIEDNKGNKKTVKKDIFGNTIIEDNRGNKTTIKKDVFEK